MVFPTPLDDTYFGNSKIQVNSGLLSLIIQVNSGKFKHPLNYCYNLFIVIYGIYEVSKASVEVYHLMEGQYHLLPPNKRGHYPITPMGVELGIWQGTYQNMELPWLRWWDLDGNLLLDGHETAENERQRAEYERQQAEYEKEKSDS